MQMSIGNIDEELREQQKRPDREQNPIIVAAKGIRDAARTTQGEKVGGRGPIWIDHLDLKPSSIPHSFVLYGQEKESSSLVPDNILEQADLAQPQNSLGGASQNELKLEDLAAKELPARLGRRYIDIVLLCLQCLDPGSGADQDGKGFGVNAANWTDEDGVTIGVRYIENVLEKMQEITM
jgi:hypothetical protein